MGNNYYYSHEKILSSRLLSKKLKINIYHQCSAQGQVLHCKLRHQGCNSGQRQVFHCKLRNLGYSFIRDEQMRQFPVGFRTPLSLQHLKFTTEVKYQFNQGFRPDQRSGNPDHPSPPYNYYITCRVVINLVSP